MSITKIILWRLQYKVGKDQLQAIAHEAMLQRGLLPDFSADSRSRLHRRSGGIRFVSVTTPRGFIDFAAVRPLR